MRTSLVKKRNVIEVRYKDSENVVKLISLDRDTMVDLLKDIFDAVDGLQEEVLKK